MKNLFTILLSVLIIAVGIEIKPAPFDTGMNELQQPDETTFIGRIWGDEFFDWMETEDGYRFVQSGDGWYYYATLDQYGEFAPTIYKVGIDSPLPSSYQLERTQARIDEINQQIQGFNEQIELNRQWFLQKQAEAQGQPVTLKVAIILIEFKDVKHYRDTIPPTIRPDGYITSDFDSMMFSYNYWIGGINNPKHPEGERIFGSFRDYWHQMSKGKLKITGKVVNPTDENGVPEWLEADSTRNYYARLNAGTQWNTLAVEAIEKAILARYISTNPNDTNYYHKYAVIYAREAIEAGALKVHAEGEGEEYKYHLMAERSGPNLYGGNLSEKSFSHIGTFAHEFGHTLGFWDEYRSGDDGQTDLLNFCLMAYGLRNGPDRKAACPATLSPYYRLEKLWLPEPELIDNDETNFLVAYDYDYPKLYKIDPVGPPEDMYYLFEVRHRQGFDAYIPEPPETFEDQSGTLLIWQYNILSLVTNCSQLYIDRIRLKAADNVYNQDTQLNDFFPSDGYQNNQDFNGLTAPVASLGNLGDWVSSNEIRPAHFALNGIYKDGNDNTVISEIKKNYAMLQSEYNSIWNLVSVPVGLEDYSVSTVFPTAISVYNSNYQLVTSLANGPGYWAKFPSEVLKNFEGDIIEAQEIPVIQGWQIIGTNSYKTRRPFLHSSPPNIIETIYRFENGGYILMDTCFRIKSGYGYWTKTSSAGTIYMDNISPLNKITSSGDIDLASMDKFIITDSEEYSQTLYVSNIDIDTIMAGMNLDLPPLFPEINFDSRFLYNELVKKVSADSGVIDLSILVHTFSYPVTLSWEINPANGISYSFVGDSGFGKTGEIMSTAGSHLFNNLDNGRIQMKAFVNKNNNSNNIPTEYALAQNYPNPFNPTTTIKYDLPKTSDVSLIIYDILGRKIKELVKVKQEPGRYEVQFDASHLSSGIYIYQIIAEKYMNSKKMILLK